MEICTFRCWFLLLLILSCKCQEEENQEENNQDEENQEENQEGENQERKNIFIGVIFETTDNFKELALNISIEDINSNHHLKDYDLSYILEKTSADHPFESLASACTLLENGVVAIFGPPSEENANAIQSLCDEKEIPLIQIRWDAQQLRSTISLNLYPYPPVLAKVFVDIVEAWKWKSFTILYESKEGLFRISELLRMYNSSGDTIVVRQLDENNSQNFRPTLKEAMNSGHYHFIIDCSTENLQEVLTQAQQVGLITARFNFIITNLDLHTIDFEPFRYSEANITGVRIVSSENRMVNRFSRLIYEDTTDGTEEMTPGWTIRSDVALLVDAVNLFNGALNEVISTVQPRPLECNSPGSSGFGYNILSYMKTTPHYGLTGLIKFDHEGFRSDFSLEVVELVEEGMQKIGTWNSTEGLTISRKYPEVNKVDDSSLRNRTFRVITATTAPYAMLKKSETKLTGNEQYEGFAIDLIHELSLMEGFFYEIKIREDKKNGAKINDKQWDGMIGDVMDGRADLAIADLTITAEREEAVDFTEQFMTLGVSILYRKATKAPPGFFSFASPFGNDVWITLAGAYLCVSVAFFITGRLSPSEWTNPFPCIEEPKYLLNQFSLRNSFWFTIGSLMQQGSEVAPIAISTRMVAGFWWFFTLIMVSSYTANLAAFLTADTPLSEFGSVRELVDKADHLGIGYGAKKDGATANFFKGSGDPYYQKIAEHMNKTPEDMPTENSDGVRLAETRKYAFFMESSSIEYETARHCNLTQIGNRLDEKGYGIAMRKNSTYRHALSTAVLKLQESGKIRELKNRWWKERGAKQCDANEGPSGDASPLDIINVSGIFWVTILGVILAFFLVLVELFVHVLKVSVRHRIPLGKELVNEVKNCFSETKPVRQKLDSPEGSENENEDKKSIAEYGFKPTIPPF